MQATVQVANRFASFLTDWEYNEYLLIGGYGSGKSYHTAFKIILKLLEEKRTALVVRQVKETIKDSCFALFKDILETMNMLSDTTTNKQKSIDGKVIAVSSPMEIRFPNGSKIIFRGADNTEKLKSIHNVSIVWIEECSEVRYDIYTELLGRIRTPNKTLYTFLTCNPVGKENWVFNNFFTHVEENGDTTVICDENKFYRLKTLVVNGTYYHHSTLLDNPFLPRAYIDRIDKLKMSDPRRWVVARWGRFGANGTRVLPQFEIAKDAKAFVRTVNSISSRFHFFGLDFGFETSYNALISCCVDDANKILYIYDEVYRNKITDDKFSNLESVHKTMERASRCNKPICADSAEPKTIQYYRQQGFDMYGCKKFVGSRLSNTKKVKRFNKIVCSPKCKNTIRELKDLTYAKDSKGNAIYDEFNIDPHTFKCHNKLGVYKRMEKTGKAEKQIRAEVMQCIKVA